jgi:hypothetical protein
MGLTSWRSVGVVHLTAVLAVPAIPASARAQSVGSDFAASSETARRARLLDASPFAKPLAPDPLRMERARWTAAPRDLQQTAAHSRGHAVAWGIVAGAIGGAALAGVAAEVYGGNEGGSCSRCFVQGAAFTVPAGAAVGALIGHAISRRRVSP